MGMALDMKTPTTPHVCMRSGAQVWWAAIPLTVRIWPRSPRCRVLKMLRIARTVAHERALADCVIARHRKRLHGRARRITIDLDPTDDPTHGQQQFTFFNSHYDSYCYLPMVGFSPSTTRRTVLVAAVLRRVMFGSCGAIGICALASRLDSAFPERSSACAWRGLRAGGSGVSRRQPRVEYVVTWPPMRCWIVWAERPCVPFAACPRKWRDRTRLWRVPLQDEEDLEVRASHPFKAEVTRHPNRDPKDNPRFVVTNMNRVPDGSTRRSTANAATGKSH